MKLVLLSSNETDYLCLTEGLGSDDPGDNDDDPGDGGCDPGERSAEGRRDWGDRCARDL